METSWWNRAFASEVVIPSVLTLIVGFCAVWYARQDPVPRKRQRDFAVSLRQIKIFEQPVTRTNEFAFRGKPVCEVAQYRLVFANTGYEAIVRKDFDQPLTLQTAQLPTIAQRHGVGVRSTGGSRPVFFRIPVLEIRSPCLLADRSRRFMSSVLWR